MQSDGSQANTVFGVFLAFISGFDYQYFQS